MSAAPAQIESVLARALAKTLGLSFQRIQFTGDLLPADILGVSIFEREFQAAVRAFKPTRSRAS